MSGKKIISETMGTGAVAAEPGKGRLFRTKKAVAALCGAVYLALCAMPMTAFAAGAGAITQPLESLKTIVIAVIGAIGVIILAKNVMDVRKLSCRTARRTSSRIRPP